MISISNSGYSPFNPAEFQRNAQKAFSAADSDENGTVSKSEATSALQDKGMSDNAIDKMFSQMDGNGDGEISSQEQADAFEKMQERMASMQGGMGFNQQTESASLFESLLQSLSEDQEEDDEEINDLLEKLKEDPTSDEVKQEASNLINQRIPAVDTTA
jgi:Ca2+-binding EF-hand superfamily protein